MFVIGIEKTRSAELAEGTAARINGCDTTLRREGDYLIYKDEDGVENRCLILMEGEDGTRLQFTCASHGQEGERHLVITPDEDYEFVNGRVASTEQTSTKHYVDLFAHETIVRWKRIIIEAPADWDPTRLRNLDGAELARLADEHDCDAYWEFYEPEDFEELSGVEVEPAPDDSKPDIVFKVNKVGDLIEVESGNPAAFVD